jgi:hypothetical protein
MRGASFFLQVLPNAKNINMLKRAILEQLRVFFGGLWNLFFFWKGFYGVQNLPCGTSIDMPNK